MPNQLNTIERDFSTLDLSDQRKQIAVHEAGHALAALKLGVDFTCIALREGATPGEVGGFVDTLQHRRTFIYDRKEQTYSRQAAARHYAKRDAVVHYAGLMTESYVCGGYWLDAVQHDIQATRDSLATAFPTEEVDRLQKAIETRTLNLLRKYRLQLVEIALTLMDRGTMTKVEVQRCIRGLRCY